MRYPGFQIWEVWGDALLLPKDSAAWGACKHLYKHCIHGVRIMAKFEEYVNNGERFEELTLGKVMVARELGLKVMLCIDWHNVTHDSAGYHTSRWFPKDIPKCVEAMVELIGPDVVQVANEPYYLKKGKDLTTAQYADYVYQYVEGLKKARWQGLLVAEQTRAGEQVAKGWEWHVEWDYCAEGKHRLPRVLHDWTTAD